MAMSWFGPNLARIRQQLCDLDGHGHDFEHPGQFRPSLHGLGELGANSDRSCAKHVRLRPTYVQLWPALARTRATFGAVGRIKTSTGRIGANIVRCPSNAARIRPQIRLPFGQLVTRAGRTLSNSGCRGAETWAISTEFVSTSANMWPECGQILGIGQLRGCPRHLGARGVPTVAAIVPEVAALRCLPGDDGLRLL